MKLSEILSVKCHKLNGIPYSWSVIHKSRAISQMEVYNIPDSAGRSSTQELPLEKLPKTIQKFCSTHSSWEVENVDGFSKEQWDCTDKIK